MVYPTQAELEFDEPRSKSRPESARIETFSENSNDSRLVIDDAAAIPTRSWGPKSGSMRQDSGLRSESIDSQDPLGVESDNEGYDQQVNKNLI